MRAAAQRFYGTMIGLALLAWAMFVLTAMVIPAGKNIRELKGERQSLIALVAKESAAIQAAERLLSEYKNTKDLENSLNATLPHDQDIPGIVNQIHGMAKLSSISLRSIELFVLPIEPAQEETAIKPIGTVRITVDVNGTYEAVKKFVELAETNIRIMDIDTLRVEGEAEGQSGMSYNIIMDVYYQQ